MSKLIVFLILLVGCNCIGAQQKIIFDTDFGGDADDLGALVMLHNYIDNDQCDLLAVMSWSDEEYAVAGIDAVNRFYNHPDIPIGTRKVPSDRIERCYGYAIASNFTHVLDNDSAMDASTLYRKILAKSKNKSVTIITVGPLKNIENLLNSKGDDISCMSGEKLVKKKVKEFVIMGGKYPNVKWEWNFSGGMEGVTKNVIEKLKTPITFVGAELGEVIKTGAIFNNIDQNTPLYKGFMHFSEYAPWMKEKFAGEILDNATFDQLAVLYAVENGEGKYWQKIEGSYCKADNNGGNDWIKKKKSNHSYLKFVMKKSNIENHIEYLMLDNEKTRVKK
ncbi:MAG: nucleoside hydrolase [Saprospiraceae bacterium]